MPVRSTLSLSVEESIQVWPNIQSDARGTASNALGVWGTQASSLARFHLAEAMEIIDQGVLLGGQIGRDSSVDLSGGRTKDRDALHVPAAFLCLIYYVTTTTRRQAQHSPALSLTSVSVSRFKNSPTGWTFANA
jgi:hypothetical protein